jgi:hypothetical protein
MDAKRVARRIEGDNARRKGSSLSSSVVRVRIEDVVWICLGRWTRRRAVRMQNASGIKENSRSPTVSPQVGSVCASHIKLPMKAHNAEIKRVAGMNTDVAIMTGWTNIRRSRICVYAAIALKNVNIVSIGTVCNRVV